MRSSPLVHANARRAAKAQRTAAAMNSLPIAVLVAAATLPFAHYDSSGPYVKAPALGIHIGTL